MGQREMASINFESELAAPITLNLSNNRLIMKAGKFWTVEHSDMEKAATCIEALVQKLEYAQSDTTTLKQELHESTETKAATLQLVLLLILIDV